MVKEIEAEMAERTVIPVAKAVMASQEGKSYREDIVKHLKEDARFVDIHFEDEQQTNIVASIEEFLIERVKAEQEIWMRNMAQSQMDIRPMDDSSEDEENTGVGKGKRALRRSEREAAEGMVRIQDDRTERKQPAIRQRESDGGDEGEKEK